MSRERALQELIAKWRQEQALYPLHESGQSAAAAVRCCATELEALLSADAPAVSTQAPAQVSRICSQCGKSFTETACGPTHALIAHEAVFYAQNAKIPTDVTATFSDGSTVTKRAEPPAVEELIAKWRELGNSCARASASTVSHIEGYRLQLCADELEAVLAVPQAAPQEQAGTPFEPLLTDLVHTRSCPSLTPLHEEDCTCGLYWRIRLRTGIEMHNAWRKRAEEAEQLLLLVPHDHSKTNYPGPATCVRCAIEVAGQAVSTATEKEPKQ